MALRGASWWDQSSAECTPVADYHVTWRASSSLTSLSHNVTGVADQSVQSFGIRYSQSAAPAHNSTEDITYSAVIVNVYTAN